jgi:hypothetical protein
MVASSLKIKKTLPGFHEPLFHACLLKKRRCDCSFVMIETRDGVVQSQTDKAQRRR